MVGAAKRGRKDLLRSLNIMQDQNWKRKTLIYGGLIGLVSGLLSAFFRIKRAEENHKTIRFSSKDTLKLGSSVFDLINRFF